MSSEGTKTMQGTALTKRQRQVLEIVRSSVRERGVAPTYAEIGHAAGGSNIARQCSGTSKRSRGRAGSKSPGSHAGSDSCAKARRSSTPSTWLQ